MAEHEPPKPLVPDPLPRTSTTDLRARFATPIESTEPVNPDAQSGEPFAELPTAEEHARASERKPG